MTSYRFDLYPRTDPRDGTLIRSFTELQKAAYRAEANGTSTGQIAVRSTTDDGQAIDPLGLQYVRVVELPGGSVRGGFFLEKGKFQALSEDEDSLLTFSGAGTLAYLARAAMAPHTYLDIAIGTDPYDDTWRWGDQGPAAGGDYIGAALWRTIYEAQHFRVALTEHRHADGVIYTDSHDDDRTESAIPDVVMTFDQFTDSSGNAWTIASGDLKSQVGESVLSVVKRLMEAGLYVELDPDTFELNAWEQDVHRAMLDATGTAWATDVVRFQAPTDPDDITTGNIKDDAVRNIEAYIKRSALWAGGSDVYGLATSGTDIPWEGHYRADIDDAEALEAIAAVQLQAISEAGDTLKLQLWMEDDPANGRYLPWDHVKLDQQVTVHTGTDQWEFDERTFPVAALTIELRQGGNWQAIVELGASYSATASRQFQVQAAAGHSHRPNPELCRPGIAGSADWLFAGTATDGGGADEPNAIDGDEGSLAETTSGLEFFYRDLGAAYSISRWQVIQDPAENGVRKRTGMTLAYRVNPVDSWTVVDTATMGGAGCSDSGEMTFTPVAARYWRLQSNNVQCSAGLTFSWRITEWYLGGAAISGTVNDGHRDLVGTSPRAARCDHRHDVHRDTAPTVDDDWATAGYKLGTIWAQLDDLEAPTEIVGVWMLIDNSTGAAVWSPWPAASHDHDADYVAVDDTDWVDLTDGGATTLHSHAGSGSSITVEEDDGSPSVTATKIVFDNGTVTDEGSGVARVTNSGGGGGGLTQAYAGKNAIGGSIENGTDRRVYMKKITLANACLITDIEAYVDGAKGSAQVDGYSVILYADNSGTPRETLSFAFQPVNTFVMDHTNNSTADSLPRWLGAPIGRWVAAGDYWIAVQFLFQGTGGFRIYHDGSGSDRYFTSGGDWMVDAGFYTITTTTTDYSIRANTIR